MILRYRSRRKEVEFSPPVFDYLKMMSHVPLAFSLIVQPFTFHHKKNGKVRILSFFNIYNIILVINYFNFHGIYFRLYYVQCFLKIQESNTALDERAISQLEKLLEYKEKIYPKLSDYFPEKEVNLLSRTTN